MRPLEPLASISPIARLLAGAPEEDVRAEIQRLERETLSPVMSAALQAARGLLAIRSGDNQNAQVALASAAEQLRAAGEAQAATIAQCEALVAQQRVSRAAIPAVIASLRTIEEAADRDDLVFATAAVVRGAAHMASSDPDAAIDALAAALRRSKDHLPERVRALNSLGTLYTALGQGGAATAALEHACELARRLGLATSEAIARGQLGSLALARGEGTVARAHFGAQELLAARLGDRHGQARALVYLAEVALDAQQAGVALDLAGRARKVAQSADPPLAMFDAFAERIEQGAARAMGIQVADDAVNALRARFTQLRVSLGVALVDADSAKALSGPEAAEARERALVTFASLGLTQRMASLLLDARAASGSDAQRDDLDEMIAVLAQLHPHVADAHAADLLFLAPHVLATLGARSLAAQRNLAKLAALHFRGGGLTLAVAIVGDPACSMPEAGSLAALASAFGLARAWVWPVDSPRDIVLAELRRMAGARLRAILVTEPSARVASVPLAGEPFATLVGVDLLALAARAHTVGEGAIET